MYLILSKIQGQFQMVSSTFLSTMDVLDVNFTMPSLEEFYEAIT